MRQIGYNSQRDNFDFAGKFPGWSQCFSTASWMFMSFYSPAIIATDDKALAGYVDDVTAMVGQPGTAEEVKAKNQWMKGDPTFFWETHQAAIQKWLGRLGVKGNCVYRNGLPLADLPALVARGPVIIGTWKMGGLPGGHLILLVDYDSKAGEYLVNDPYGDARTNYRNQSGDGVRYVNWWLNQYVQVGAKRCNVIFWEGA